MEEGVHTLAERCRTRSSRRKSLGVSMSPTSAKQYTTRNTRALQTQTLPAGAGRSWAARTKTDTPGRELAERRVWVRRCRPRQLRCILFTI